MLSQDHDFSWAGWRGVGPRPPLHARGYLLWCAACAASGTVGDVLWAMTVLAMTTTSGSYASALQTRVVVLLLRSSSFPPQHIVWLVLVSNRRALQEHGGPAQWRLGKIAFDWREGLSTPAILPQGLPLSKAICSAQMQSGFGRSQPPRSSYACRPGMLQCPCGVILQRRPPGSPGAGVSGILLGRASNLAGDGCGFGQAPVRHHHGSSASLVAPRGRCAQREGCGSRPCLASRRDSRTRSARRWSFLFAHRRWCLVRSPDSPERASSAMPPSLDSRSTKPGGWYLLLGHAVIRDRWVAAADGYSDPSPY